MSDPSPPTPCEPFTPERISSKSNYTFTCIDRVNTNYKSANATINGNVDALTTLVINNLITLNVKTFGAVGDGITDDTVAINNTISAISNTGGILYLPFGTYKITSYIDILNKNKFTIKSDNATIYNFGHSNKVFNIQNCDGLSFSGQLNFTINTSGLTNSIAIYIINSNKCKIKDINIEGAWGYGILLDDNGPGGGDARTSIISNINVDGAGVGVRVVGEYYTVCDSFFYNCTQFGVCIYQGNFTLNNCTICRNRVGVIVDGTAVGGNLDHGKITNNTINHNWTCNIFLKKIILSMIVSNNHIWGSNANVSPYGNFSLARVAGANTTTYGVYLENTTTAMISNNTIAQNDCNIGIDGCVYTLITNNIFKDGYVYCIKEWGEYHTDFGTNFHNNFSNNQFYGASGTGKRIDLLDSNNPFGYVVSNNRGNLGDHHLCVLTAGLTYLLGTAEIYTVYSPNIAVTASDDNPANQSTQIIIPSTMFGSEFKIVILYSNSAKSIYLRVRTTSAVAPKLGTYTAGFITYSVAYKAFRLQGVDIFTYIPYGNTPMDAGVYSM